MSSGGKSFQTSQTPSISRIVAGTATEAKRNVARRETDVIWTLKILSKGTAGQLYRELSRGGR
jgi:hypothetical protein